LTSTVSNPGGGKKCFLYSEISNPFLGSTQPHIKGKWVSFLVVKRPGHKVGDLCSYRAEFKKWTRTSIFQIPAHHLRGVTGTTLPLFRVRLPDEGCFGATLELQWLVGIVYLNEKFLYL